MAFGSRLAITVKYYNRPTDQTLDLF